MVEDTSGTGSPEPQSSKGIEKRAVAAAGSLAARLWSTFIRLASLNKEFDHQSARIDRLTAQVVTLSSDVKLLTGTVQHIEKRLDDTVQHIDKRLDDIVRNIEKRLDDKDKMIEAVIALRIKEEVEKLQRKH